MDGDSEIVVEVCVTAQFDIILLHSPILKIYVPEFLRYPKE